MDLHAVIIDELLVALGTRHSQLELIGQMTATVIPQQLFVFELFAALSADELFSVLTMFQLLVLLEGNLSFVCDIADVTVVLGLVVMQSLMCVVCIQ